MTTSRTSIRPLQRLRKRHFQRYHATRSLDSLERMAQSALMAAGAKRLCHAHNQGGLPCERPAVPGKRVCYRHGGAPGTGAPKGNQNARKHGFYSKAGREAPRERLDELVQVRGLDEEVAYARMVVRDAFEAGGDFLAIVRAMDILTRMVLIQHRLRQEGKARQTQEAALRETLERLLKEFGLDDFGTAPS